VTLTGKQFTGLPSIGGYKLTYFRAKAKPAAGTTDENKAPGVASWEARGGGGFCYMGRAGGEDAGGGARLEEAGRCFRRLGRRRRGRPAWQYASHAGREERRRADRTSSGPRACRDGRGVAERTPEGDDTARRRRIETFEREGGDALGIGGHAGDRNPAARK